MHLISVGLLASFVLSFTTASAQTTTPVRPAGATAPAKPEKAKKVCRSFPVTGQRIPRRECRTEAEWASIDAARDSMEAIRLRTNTPQGN